jgi:hypothetical protein
MLLPYLGLILGIAVIVYAVLAFMGSGALASAPAALRRPGDPLWLAGLVLLALALLLGWVGYSFDIELRLVRILVGIAGVVLLVLAWPRTTRPA